MSNKIFLQKLGFTPKENISGIFYKNYKIADGYSVEVDIEKRQFNFGAKIKLENRTTQNFSQEENWVVFECVNHLLEKGYKPEDIILEKTWETGHGTSGRIDILVNKNKQAYLMIECKTWGNEFEKEFKKMQKDGGQLFTYFQQDTKAQYLMLYTSEFDGKNINYKNEIVKIEEHYKGAGNVKDFYNRWNKISNQNGIFEDWVSAYHFENKALLKKDLIHFTKKDSESIFNRFDSILRKHCVSDAPNAFNKIFNLFLAKIFDEKKETEELGFQWKENRDNDVRFQVRLINLYRDGMLEFLKKEIIGINRDDFKESLSEEEIEKKEKEWLMFNNVFAIKEVIDEETFDDNAKVLKEVVQLLSKYKIRYPRQQQHLSDFFERLLTTGLKQKAGQFFTPPPIARFIIKSLPLKKVIETKLKKDKQDDILPSIIDYAAGSGHFLTESMEEMQKIIDNIEDKNLHDYAKKRLKNWKDTPFDWASKYIYGIEKDYRLVKVAKVGCYFYGDGLAQVIYGDGLDSFFESKSYRGLLKENAKKSQFDFVISNPPYSVKHFKGDIKNKNPKESFALYNFFTDDSKEIEVLFIERTKQLLKQGGIASIVLPSTILSNIGIYAKAREILLKYFEIIAITEFGSNTFMKTNISTVVLFLHRKNNNYQNIENSIKKFFQNFQDITVNGIENIFSKYVNFVWKDINFEDYISLTQNKPNKNIQKHEIYLDYQKKIKVKNEEDLQKKIIEIETEKLLYFILAYPQKVVVVKSGEKKEEKAFLGYEFSDRKGKEGAHPIQRGKTIDECTKLFDSEKSDNSQKASTYILDAFDKNFERKIDESLSKNISRIDLIDMMIFDRVDFDKSINTNAGNKIKIETKYDLIKLGDNIKFLRKSKRSAGSGLEKGKYPFFTSSQIQNKFLDVADYNEESIIIGDGGDSSIHLSKNFSVSDHNFVLKSNNDKLRNRFIYYFYKFNFNLIREGLTGSGLKNISKEYLKDLRIPLPPKDIQEKIIDEIEILEDKEKKINQKNKELKNKIPYLIKSLKNNDLEKLENLASIGSGGTPSMNIFEYWENGNIPWLKSEVCKENFVFEAKDFITELGLRKSNAKYFKPDTTLIALVGTTKGKTAFLKFKSTTNQNIAGISSIDTNKILNEYIFYVLKGMYLEIIKNLGQYDMLSLSMIKYIKIPVPTINEQKKIVAQIIKIENQISKLNQELQKIKNAKNEVLKNYE